MYVCIRSRRIHVISYLGRCPAVLSPVCKETTGPLIRNGNSKTDRIYRELFSKRIAYKEPLTNGATAGYFRVNSELPRARACYRRIISFIRRRLKASKNKICTLASLEAVFLQDHPGCFSVIRPVNCERPPPPSSLPQIRRIYILISTRRGGGVAVLKECLREAGSGVKV